MATPTFVSVIPTNVRHVDAGARYTYVNLRLLCTESSTYGICSWSNGSLDLMCPFRGHSWRCGVVVNCWSHPFCCGIDFTYDTLFGSQSQLSRGFTSALATEIAVDGTSLDSDPCRWGRCSSSTVLCNISGTEKNYGTDTNLWKLPKNLPHDFCLYSSIYKSC